MNYEHFNSIFRGFSISSRIRLLTQMKYVRNKRQRTSLHYFVDYLLQFSNWIHFVQMGQTLFWSIVAIFLYYNSVKDLQDMEWKHSSLYIRSKGIESMSIKYHTTVWNVGFLRGTVACIIVRRLLISVHKCQS